MNTQQTDLTQQQNKEQVVDDSKGLQSSYIKLEKEKRKKLTITNWRTVETIKQFEEGKNEKVTLWKADVVSEDGVQCEKEIEIKNISFRKKINDMLAPKNRDALVVITIKRFGEGKATTYDVELVAEA